MNVVNAESIMKEIKLVGSTRCVAKDIDGNIVSEKVSKNNILLQIRQPIIRLLGGVMTDPTTLPFINAIGFGSDNTPPDINQTGLIAQVNNSRRLLAMAPTFSTDGLQVTFAVLYDLVDNAIDEVFLREACLYTTEGVAVARTTIGEYKKEPGLFFEFYWTIGYQA